MHCFNVFSPRTNICKSKTHFVFYIFHDLHGIFAIIMKGMYDIDLESRVDIVKCLVWNFVSITFLSQRVTKVLKTEQVFYV